MSTNGPSSAEAGYEGITFENMLQDTLACGVILVDSTGAIVSANAEAERALSLSCRSAKSTAGLPEPLLTLFQEAQQTGRAVSERRVSIPSGDAREAELAVTIMPVARAKQPGFVVVLLKDLSTVASLESQMRRLDRLASVGLLSASMAHEIKNALVAVKTFVDLLLEKNQDAELAGIVRREMGRVESIVSHMLKFAAPARPAFAPVSLHGVLDHSLRLVQHRIGSREITFNRRFDLTTDSFSGDEHQLEQAFVNLLFNAVEAMGAEGTLTVSTEESPAPLGKHENGAGVRRWLHVRIVDSGIGISPENIKRIFEPFFTTKQHGTGLGLAVTRRIIEEHNGVIEVDSEQGKGTTFTVTLPMPPNAGVSGAAA